MKKEISQNSLGSSLNTLAQNGTGRMITANNKRQITVGGNGTELSDVKVLRGRAKRKMITQKMMPKLIDMSTNKGNRKKTKAYWNTFYCQGKVYVSNGKIYSKYCKNRFCTVCLAIRKAEIINKYLPVISTWEQPYFVTLTVKAVPLAKLNNLVKRGIIRGFRRITARCRKRNLRGNGIKLMGIKSLECNFNPIKKTYNPHLHIIVPNEKIADELINEWILQWKGEKAGFVNRQAQHKQKVKNNERALIEIVKYGSKIFSEPDVNKKSKQKGAVRNIYVAALDNIFSAMKGCRIFERFGFNLPKSKNRTPKNTVLNENEYVEFIYDPKLNDWVNSETGQTLTGYLPTAQLEQLLKENINTELE